MMSHGPQERPPFERQMSRTEQQLADPDEDKEECDLQGVDDVV